MLLAMSILVLYSLALFYFSTFWKKVESEYSGGGSDLSITVVVPFRNEVENLKALADCLNQQSYSSFEVVFVDDHSDDGSWELLQGIAPSFNFRFKMEQLESGNGKKKAILHAIDHSASEIILTTDADCTMGKDWIETMLSPFVKDDVQLAIGPVMLKGDAWWKKLQSIEFSALIGMTKVLADLKRPTMANGANLAFTRSAFEKVMDIKELRVPPREMMNC